MEAIQISILTFTSVCDMLRQKKSRASNSAYNLYLRTIRWKLNVLHHISSQIKQQSAMIFLIMGV